MGIPVGYLWWYGPGTVLIVTLDKSETYKETIKEKSTILPYSTRIHKRIHVRPLRNSIQGIHVNVKLSIPSRQGTVLKEAATVSGTAGSGTPGTVLILPGIDL